ncbi:hypothetical protein ACQEVS_24760 [Streptomyces sp. CA-181903]|uniref:hypothetical protein n=1 Tax=Streptomyces sp. CA-181903 TaxID=3240055 RepID=UPI003D91A5E7
MAFTTTARARGPRRRALLTGAAALLLTGCAGGRDGDGADGRTRAAAVRDTAALLARYDATLAAHPGLAPRLRPLRAETARHAAAFGATAAPVPSSSAPPPAVPDDPDQALATLAAAERRTADGHTAALAAAPPELARLLASVAASGAAHAYLLGADA